MTRIYGWKRDKPDARDYRLAQPVPVAALPKRVDLRPYCPPVIDQGQLGACTAHACCGAHQMEQIKQDPKKAVAVSRLQNYYDARAYEGTTNFDAGAQLRDNLKASVQFGIGAEKLWPYDPRKFTVKPPDRVYADGFIRQVTSYLRLDQSVDAMRQCLAAGYPFMFGFTVYQNFETPAMTRTGILNLPTRADLARGPLGGHAVLAVGYDHPAKRIIVRNSYSASWGQRGYFTMPYAYILDLALASDFWTIRMVEIPASNPLHPPSTRRKRQDAPQAPQPAGGPRLRAAADTRLCNAHRPDCNEADVSSPKKRAGKIVPALNQAPSTKN